MGYYASITAADFTIPTEKLDAAFEALKELDKHNDLKSGGSFGTLPDGTHGQKSWHFAWMGDDWTEKCKSVGDVLAELGFEISGTDGDLEIYGYATKSGDEEHFLRALAPFVKPGSYLEWEGEDSQRWRQDFDGETMTEKSGRTIWE
ncbi:hypothetical protein PBI_BEAGLE_94 [Arthrobacter phage Beagle]|nr:hypothetical protein PBI_BEAGLE_94 [Arthrobacter phage Beagle]